MRNRPRPYRSLRGKLQRVARLDAYLAKPFEATELEAILRGVVGQTAVEAEPYSYRSATAGAMREAARAG